jgi:hypothetical protein
MTKTKKSPLLNSQNFVKLIESKPCSAFTEFCFTNSSDMFVIGKYMVKLVDIFTAHEKIGLYIRADNLEFYSAQKVTFLCLDTDTICTYVFDLLVYMFSRSVI